MINTAVIAVAVAFNVPDFGILSPADEFRICGCNTARNSGNPAALESFIAHDIASEMYVAGQKIALTPKLLVSD